MPELIEQMYCSQQIVIPPKFPYILKRYCKAAIKTQPYDLLRWSFEYFRALAEHRPPPVKLRLEYPVFSTEGGLTRGCLKVIANQLAGMAYVPLPLLKHAWGGFCLDKMELKQILCLCEVYSREESVPFLHFIAVAAGLLTKNSSSNHPNCFHYGKYSDILFTVNASEREKTIVYGSENSLLQLMVESLTHTMILLCESLTKEPDGGSAAIPIKEFLVMYQFLANIDASKDVKYVDGYREGETPTAESEEEEESKETQEEMYETSSDDYWEDMTTTQKINVINDKMPITTKLSDKLAKPAIGPIKRSPSVEREVLIERENYLRERKGRPSRSDEVDQKLRDISTEKMSKTDVTKEGEPKEIEAIEEEHSEIDSMEAMMMQDEPTPVEEDPAAKLAEFLESIFTAKKERMEDLETTFDEIAALVNRWKSANYDLGMVAGRQMSTTSGEFIVQHIEKEIMDYINEQIAILPDPDLKKKKAKPEEVEMIRHLLETFLDENMDVIVPEIQEVEEEELPIPDIVVVYAVPGIGPIVERSIVNEFVDYALDACKVQADLFMPRNIRHFMCPPLEKFEEVKYELPASRAAKEEAVTGGVITD